MAILLAVKGLPAGETLPLGKEITILGRHPECDIVLDSGAISRQHARILRVGEEFYVEDLQSRNGTQLNGTPVKGRQRLSAGDRVGLCDIVFQFFERPDQVSGVRGQGSGDRGQGPGVRGQGTGDRGQGSGVSDRSDRRRQGDTGALMVDDEASGPRATVMSRVDVSSGHTSLRLEVNPQAKLKALLEISRSLGRALGLEQVLPKLLESLFAIFPQADRGLFVLPDPATGKLVPRVLKHRREGLGEAVRVSRTIVERVMASKEAILSADAASDSRFGMADSIVDFHLRSVMCAPLIGSEGRAMGVVQLDTADQRGRFNLEDLDLLASVACQAAIAVENADLHETAMRQQALDRELGVAHDVLRGFLPAAPPRIGQYEFFDFYEPAHELGGDYYDYVPLGEGRLAVVVADVSGKGIPASLLMAKLSSDVRYCLASEPAPADAVARLNRTFCQSGWADRFVTMVLAVLDPRRHEVTLVNAGHLPPLVRRGAEVTMAVPEEAVRLPLGVDENVDYVQTVRPMAQGDSLALYTDGVTEAMNERDELYGSQRLAAQLAGGPEGVAAQSRQILRDVKEFVGSRPQSDDMCLVCFGRTSEPA
ncbi:MAG: SpoIIE family protein phosphatase [Thermoguttaceae bacterium]|jgi:serine phosphatase RsbU (regulator of sigma subunit)